MDQDWNPVILQKSKPKSSSNPVNAIKKDDEIPTIRMFTKEMGQTIARLRNEKQWTQEQLAQRLRIPKQTILLLEQGKEKYNGPLVAKLKKELGNFDW
jgi:DNA-binding XRE family transcriptional regulator